MPVDFGERFQLSEGFLLYAIVEITMQLQWRCARLGTESVGRGGGILTASVPWAIDYSTRNYSLFTDQSFVAAEVGETIQTVPSCL